MNDRIMWLHEILRPVLFPFCWPVVGQKFQKILEIKPFLGTATQSLHGLVALRRSNISQNFTSVTGSSLERADDLLGNLLFRYLSIEPFGIVHIPVSKGFLEFSYIPTLG